MKIDKSIFKAYDIRGVYPSQLDENTAYGIGKAYARLIGEENPGKKIEVAVCNDMRVSTPQLKKNLIKGLTESGVTVHDFGLASTPTFYFIVGYKKLDGGVQVSASHNPKEYNGFKLVRANAAPVSGERGIYQMRDWILENDFGDIKEEGRVIEEDDMASNCINEEIKEWNIDLGKIKKFKIVVDTGNAMAILDIKEILEKIDCEVVYINEKLDGTFPAHLADPLKAENLEMASKAIKEVGADIGIVTDGDGDRYFFLDENGNEVRQEIIRGIMAQMVLRDHPGTKIGYDIRPGRITRDMILEAGGKPFVTKVGHSLIKQRLLEEDAVFGGESSGHYFYKFSFGTFEAPAIQTLKLLEFLSEKDKSFSEIIKPLKKYFHSGEINSEVEDKEGKMKELAKKYSDAIDISWLDGVTIEYNDYWFNVRPSNTEQKLRLNLEAKSKDLMEKKRDEILALIRSQF